jgi:hypothetical protein
VVSEVLAAGNRIVESGRHVRREQIGKRFHDVVQRLACGS